MYPQSFSRLQHPSRAFLTDDWLLAYCAAIQRNGSPYFFVFGFIDGTVYQISCPSGDPVWQHSVYSGYKRYHGFKWQGVNTPDRLIQFLHGSFTARSHDVTILKQSGLLRVLRHRFQVPPDAIPADGVGETHFSLFGDPGSSYLSHLRFP
jgi:hypothetical protein